MNPCIVVLNDSKSTNVSKDEKFEMSAYIAILYITFHEINARYKVRICRNMHWIWWSIQIEGIDRDYALSIN